MIQNVQAATDQQYIRVGLGSRFENRSKITIETKRIGMGYCINNGFREEVNLVSNSGFSFSPAKGYYFSVQKTFKNYNQAMEVVKSMKQLDVNAYPVILYRNTWKVYIGGSTNKDNVQAQRDKVTGRFGFTYSNIIGNNQYLILVEGDKDNFLIDVDKQNAYPQFVSGSYNSSDVSLLDLESYRYRGRIEIGRYNNNLLTAVNIVNLEDYLYGVVPSEVSSTWPKEALKAQAVCARGYAILKAGFRSDSNLSKPYKINDTTQSQVYKGYNVETNATNQAVNETKGETVTYNNRIVSTYYSSTSGGSTENVEDVWSISSPYLRSVPDLYENEPALKPWVIKLSKSEINSKLLNRGMNIGSVTEVIPEIRTNSGRVYSLRIRGTRKSVVLQTGTIRSALSLYSNKFKVIKYGDKPDAVVMQGQSGTKTKQISGSYVIDGNYQIKKASSSLDQYIVLSEDNRTNFPRITPNNKDTIYFAGQGYGHGVGMSQSGAKGMAMAGFTYKEILEHYFTGAKVR